MVSVKMLTVEVAYATPALQKVLRVQVEQCSTIETAIDRSGIVEIFPEIDLHKQKVGVFSQARKLTYVVKDGDRIEIYRELTVDPMDARRRRAK